ncbi:hypothetical protein RRG08_024441 [Elysia crispata]|uniref:Uncharacterized protein n=1 Tax=Elysia crispata TaxID=231223 RepID=A0AAE1D2A5_9GAST|nr:hypothetical protein RRG08_024441 [Elysia crispata]
MSGRLMVITLGGYDQVMVETNASLRSVWLTRDLTARYVRLLVIIVNSLVTVHSRLSPWERPCIPLTALQYHML